MLRRLHVSYCLIWTYIGDSCALGFVQWYLHYMQCQKGCAKWHSGSIVQVLCNLRYDFQVIAGPLQWPLISYRIANASNQGVFRTHIIQCMCMCAWTCTCTISGKICCGEVVLVKGHLRIHWSAGSPVDVIPVYMKQEELLVQSLPTCTACASEYAKA